MRRPWTIFLFLLILARGGASSATLARQEDRSDSPDPVHYTLDARLDAVNRLIVGRGWLSWRNPSSHPASELRFQMAWNAWRDGNSSWMRDQRLAGVDPFVGRTDQDAGYIDLTSLVVSGQHNTNLLARARFIAPDDRNGDDRTVLVVPLASPVEPGATIDLEFAWNAHVPRAFDRAGVIADAFVVTNWFPQIGVLEDDGWHCHQLRRGTRAFNEFGRYDVALTVPGTWIIGATGVEGPSSANGDGTVTHRYAAERVQDFAWTTSPDYAERTDRIARASGAAIALRLLLQPEHADQADRQFAAVRTAIEVYERRIGPFPWPQLTIVDPVAVINARAQGGRHSAGRHPHHVCRRLERRAAMGRPGAIPRPELSSRRPRRGGRHRSGSRAARGMAPDQQLVGRAPGGPARGGQVVTSLDDVVSARVDDLCLLRLTPPPERARARPSSGHSSRDGVAPCVPPS
jgi:hypothetical protein